MTGKTAVITGGATRRRSPGGVIVNNASFVGTKAPVPIAVAYGGTKAAVVSMTRSAAVALATHRGRIGPTWRNAYSLC